MLELTVWNIENPMILISSSKPVWVRVYQHGVRQLMLQQLLSGPSSLWINYYTSKSDPSSSWRTSIKAKFEVKWTRAKWIKTLEVIPTSVKVSLVSSLLAVRVQGVFTLIKLTSHICKIQHMEFSIYYLNTFSTYIHPSVHVNLLWGLPDPSPFWCNPHFAIKKARFVLMSFMFSNKPETGEIEQVKSR